MADFWDDWKKPWTQSQCEQRYVEGTKISLLELARISEVAIGALRSWCSKKDWGDKRQVNEAHLMKEVREKTIQKTRDRLSDELSDLSNEHLEAYRVCRQIATIKSKHVLAKLDKAFKPLDHPPERPEVETDDDLAAEFTERVQEESVNGVDVMMLNVLSLVIDRSVRGERLSAGLDYENLNKAIATIEQAGLQVIVKDNAVLAQLVTGRSV